MKNENHICSALKLDSFDVGSAPATIPPAPVSGVFVVGRPTTKTPPRPPCAALWLGGAAAETLHPSQILDVAADELDWLFEHTDDETDPAVVHARAAIESWLSELSDTHRAVVTAQHSPVAWPEELPGHEDDSFSLVLCISGSHASVLRSAYTPRRWPRAVERACGSLSAIVVRLAFAADPWPQRTGHKGLEEAVALRLAAQLADEKRVPIAELRSQAQGLFGRAVVAYASSRSLESAALGVT
jgi:hypothetical protein